MLLMGSIRNLVVNQAFRSIRLLEAFLLRPDLALLVRHLEIYFNFDTGCGFSRMPEGLRVNGADALSLAKYKYTVFQLDGRRGLDMEGKQGRTPQSCFQDEAGPVRRAHSGRPTHWV